MTDNDIIKANEFCSLIPTNCKECSYWGKEDCVKVMTTDTLDLINRQKAEIEALIAGQETLQKYGEEEINRLEIELKAMRGAANSYKAEIERLEETKNRLSYNLQAVLDERADHSEAVKEFAKFLVDKAENGVISIVDLPDYTREWMVKADESGFNLNTA